MINGNASPEETTFHFNLAGFYRAARADAVSDAGLSDELANLHLQQRQHAVHDGHLH